MAPVTLALDRSALGASLVMLATLVVVEALVLPTAGFSGLRVLVYVVGFAAFLFAITRGRTARAVALSSPDCPPSDPSELRSDAPATAVVVVDSAGNTISVNPAYTEITGFAEAEVAGTRLDLLHSGEGGRASFETMRRSLERCGEWRGEVWDRRKAGEAYLARMAMLAMGGQEGSQERYICLFTDSQASQQCADSSAEMAQHDSLTGLPNRALFNDRLSHAVERARRSGSQVAVMFIDLDGFKHINDTLGHAAGDRLLQGVAARLSDRVRKGDTVCRLGGDEFTVIMEGLREARQAGVVAQKMLQAFEAPFKFEGHDLHTTPSMGIAVFPDDGWDTDALLRNADVAMYQAKRAGKNNYQFYTEELTAQALERFLLDSNLREAADQGQLELDYQPQVALLTGEVIGAEALLRWNHPTLGRLVPSRFLAVAEETGMIEQIGAWVLRMACAQAMAWHGSGLQFERVSVNLSGFQFRRGDIVGTVERVLAETGLPPRLLELELTELVLLQHEQQAVQVLLRLEELGVGLAIDNFGSGYSSLGVLKRLPLDRLKIDMSLIQDLPQSEGDAAIVQSVIALGHRLGLAAIAQGVERPEQQAFLRSEGCDEAQGFLYGGPVSAEKFAKLLARPSAP